MIIVLLSNDDVEFNLGNLAGSIIEVRLQNVYLFLSTVLVLVELRLQIETLFGQSLNFFGYMTVNCIPLVPFGLSLLELVF